MAIPKRPLAVSKAKKTLPVELDWGKGIPKDHLAYINAREEALIKLHRSTKAKRSHNGVKAFVSDDTHYGPSGGSSGGANAGGASSSSNGGIGKGGEGGQSGGSSASGSSSTASSSSSTSSSSSSGSTTTSSTPEPAKTTPAPTTPSVSTSSSKAPATAASAATISKAPNVAAQVAADRLNATKAATQPQQQSIQGMINSQSSPPNAAAQAAADAYAKKTAMAKANTASYPSQGVTTAGMKPNAYTDLGAVVRQDPRTDLTKLNSFTRDQLARFTGRTPDQVSEMARTINGEYAGPNDLERAAVANTMENRLSYGSKYGGWGSGQVETMLKQFDANGYDAARVGAPNTPYSTASLDSAGMTRGLLGNIDALDPNSQFNKTAPEAVLNATHYYNPAVSSPSWGQGFTQYGAHTFGNAENTAKRVADLRNSGGAVGLAAATGTLPSEPAAPLPQSIPAPTSLGMLPGVQRDPAAARMAGLTQSFAVSPQAPPQAPQQAPQAPKAPGPDDMMGSPPGYFSQFAMTPGDIAGLKKQAMKDFPLGDLLTMQKNQAALPGFMAPITRDVQRMASQTPSGPVQTASPQAPVPQQPPQAAPVQQAPIERLGVPETYTDLTSQRDPQAALGTPNVQPQSPAAPSTPQVSALPGFTPPGLRPNFRGTPGQAYTGKMPGMGFSPLADGRPPRDSSGVPSSGWGPSSNPASYQPEAGPGDQIASDSPIQGPSNPMQEAPPVEDPAITKERQQKYAQNGATIGSIVAGPLGALVGGTLGWQMGKTTPTQRQAIASSPAALAANAQSINQMVEERGGKRDPNMKVRPEALKDVLTNPQAVASNRQKYTTLEQILAALAMGRDPETGKPI